MIGDFIPIRHTFCVRLFKYLARNLTCCSDMVRIEMASEIIFVQHHFFVFWRKAN